MVERGGEAHEWGICMEERGCIQDIFQEGVHPQFRGLHCVLLKPYLIAMGGGGAHPLQPSPGCNPDVGEQGTNIVYLFAYIGGWRGWW